MSHHYNDRDTGLFHAPGCGGEVVERRWVEAHGEEWREFRCCRCGEPVAENERRVDWAVDDFGWLEDDVTGVASA